jgi:hypothetical protein
MEMPRMMAREMYEALKASPPRARFGFGRKPALMNVDLQNACTRPAKFVTAYDGRAIVPHQMIPDQARHDPRGRLARFDLGELWRLTFVEPTGGVRGTDGGGGEIAQVADYLLFRHFDRGQMDIALVADTSLR